MRKAQKGKDEEAKTSVEIKLFPKLLAITSITFLTLCLAMLRAIPEVKTFHSILWGEGMVADNW